MIDANILLHSIYGVVLMRSKRTCRRTIPSYNGMPSKWIDRSSMM
ncbi:hypothetical protein [Mediterraneibacter gnavus]